MSTNYSNYRPDLSGLSPYAGSDGDATTGRYGGVSDDYNRRISRVRTYFRKPRNYNKKLAGLGYVLPNIGGLRLKDITTAQGKRTAIVGGPGGYVYGLAAAGSRKNLKIGRDAQGRIALVRRDGTPATPGSPGAGSGTPGGPTVPATDEYTKYEKQAPWVANYLRSLRDEGAAFQTEYEKKFLPNLTSSLNAYANLGTQTADRYARAAATASAANQAAANIAPTEAAGATGAFDPIAMAANQAAARATGDAAAENARFAATQAALGPASAAQGLLAGIQRGYTAISAEYSKKRLEDQMKLEQWMEQQKSDALDRQVQQQYNLGLLKMRGEELTANIADDEADRQAPGDRRALERDGWIVLPSGAGRRGLNITTANDGTVMYKPKSSGGGSGGSGDGLTPNQRQQLGSRLLQAYQGTTTDVLGNVTGQGPGFRDLPLMQQVSRIEQWVRQEVENGNIPRNADAIARFISTSIPFLQRKVGGQFKTDPRGRTDTWGKRIARNIVGG